eukprot:EG_transcript_12564
MCDPHILYDLIRAALLVDEAHVLLDTSSVHSLPWQPWIQTIVTRALTLGRAHCPMFNMTSDTTVEEIVGFIASHDIAKKQITERAEIAHRQTMGPDFGLSLTEVYDAGRQRKEADTDLHSTPRMDFEARPVHSSFIHLSLDESSSVIHHRQQSVASTFTTPKTIPRLRDRALSEAFGAEAAPKRFAVLVCHLHRAAPAVQQCLLTALEHCQLTLGGTSIQLRGNLTVVATTENIAAVSHLLREHFILATLVSPGALQSAPEDVTAAVPALWDGQQRLAELCKTVESVALSPVVECYLRRLVSVVRQSFAVGFEFPNWRIIRHLTIISKAWAVLQQRDFVTPSDVFAVAHHTLPHRLSIAARVTLDEYLWGSVALLTDPCSTDVEEDEEAVGDASLHRRLQLVKGLLAAVAPPL